MMGSFTTGKQVLKLYHFFGALYLVSAKNEAVSTWWKSLSGTKGDTFRLSLVRQKKTHLSEGCISLNYRNLPSCSVGRYQAVVLMSCTVVRVCFEVWMLQTGPALWQWGRFAEVPDPCHEPRWAGVIGSSSQ